jgi:hypothetical protein
MKHQLRKLIIFLLLSCCCKFAPAQKTETIYLTQGDSNTNFYIIVYPPTLPYSGYMFLIQGMFQKAEDLFVQTELPKIAAQQGILTIIPIFKTGIASFGVDTATQVSFLEILNHVTSTHKLSGLPFYVGGFSMGGTCALKYAELAYRDNYAVKPAGVFAIDSPLDFERMYNTIIREKRLLTAGKAIDEEGAYILKRLNSIFGGTPDKVLQNYYKISPYSFSDTSQQAILPIKHLPIRFYTEPDILWWLNEGVDYTGMNAFDFAAITNELRRMGNTKVEMVPTYNKGYRQPGNTRHPHSWSIAEPKDLVKWLKSYPAN